MSDTIPITQTIERVFMPAGAVVPWWKLVNPIYWLQNGDNGWAAPEHNNGMPYLPGEPEWKRKFYWFCRNPAANFMERVIGMQLRSRYVFGPTPALQTVWADSGQRGWKWALSETEKESWPWLALMLLLALLVGYSAWFVLPMMFAMMLGVGVLPFVSYSGAVVFYLGWRPHMGGFGIKLVKGYV